MTGIGRDVQSDSWHSWDCVRNIKVVSVAGGKWVRSKTMQSVFLSCDLPARSTTSGSSGESQKAEWRSSWWRGYEANCRRRLLTSMYSICAKLKALDHPGEMMQTGGLLKRFFFSLHQFGNKTMTSTSRRLRSWLDSIIQSHHATNGF